MEEMEVARIQRELAALWLQDGGIWQLYAHGAEGIEALLPSWSLDDLGASPSVDGGPTVACFDAYLAKFGEMVDDIEACLSASPEVSRGDGPKALLSEVPGAYLGDPVSFMLSEEANWGFAEAFGGAGATNLQGLVDAIDELLFREALKKREELVACQKTVEDLKKAVAGLAARVQEERAEVQGTFRDLGASSGALVLRRRRVNLGRVINDLERIVDAFEAFEAIRTVLDDANATDGEIEEVMMAFRSVREGVEDMVGRIGVIDGLLSSLVERHDSRVAQLMVDEYRERVELLKVSLRAETWRHTTDVADLRSIAGGIGGTVREEDGKVDAAGRAYGCGEGDGAVGGRRSVCEGLCDRQSPGGSVDGSRRSPRVQRYDTAAGARRGCHGVCRVDEHQREKSRHRPGADRACIVDCLQCGHRGLAGGI